MNNMNNMSKTFGKMGVLLNSCNAVHKSGTHSKYQSNNFDVSTSAHNACDLMKMAKSRL